jgi:hypothetical protein
MEALPLHNAVEQVTALRRRERGTQQRRERREGQGR